MGGEGARAGGMVEALVASSIGLLSRRSRRVLLEEGASRSQIELVLSGGRAGGCFASERASRSQ